MEAQTRADVASNLQSKGYTVVHIEEAGFTGFESMSRLNVGGVPLKEKVVFMRQLATMLDAGLPLTQALEVLTTQVKNQQFQDALLAALKDVQAGKTLSESLGGQKGIFDPMYISLIRAGEESGNLVQIVQRLADEMEKSAKFKAKVRGAMIYPGVILAVIIVVIGLLMVVLVPTITGLFEEFDSELPFATKVIIGISNFTTSYWYLILIAIIGVVAGLIYYRKTPSCREVTDDLILRAPVFGPLMQKSQIASMARTLQMLMRSGIPILDSLEITKGALSNVHYKKGIEDAKRSVEKGSSLAVPLAKNERFPVLLSRMVAVGEETGKLDEVLGKIASYYEDEVDQMADNLSRALEPLMLILMGSIVAFIAIAVYYPLFSLGDVIQ